MVGSARRALVTSIGLVLLRRRLQRQSGPGAAAALVALELFGPRLFRLRRLALWILALTIVGGLVAGAIWWWTRQSSRPGEPAPAPEMP
jgi:uncharacterized iron-regulated membrane protein